MVPSVDVSSIADLLPAGHVPAEIVPRSGGQLSTVHEVRFVDAEPLIVKQYAAQGRWKQAKELHVYRLLAANRFGPVPQVVNVDHGRAITVLTRVPGQPMSESVLTTQAQQAAYHGIGELLATLHQITMPAYGYLVTGIVDPLPDNTAYMRRQFAKKLTEFAALGADTGVSDTELGEAVRAAVATREQTFAECHQPVLCHNDLHEGNVLVDQDGVVTGIIDVENMLAADPLIDLAKTLQYDRDHSPLKRAALLDGYGVLPPNGTARLCIYRLYHALELWDWFASTGNTEPLPNIADDIRALAVEVRSGIAEPANRPHRNL
jgi:aminoglycoside phosphotransferase (APT) family kinase protein